MYKYCKGRNKRYAPIITDRFRIHNSEQFEDFSESSGNVMYLGIGGPQAFATSTRGDGRTNNEGSDTALNLWR